MIGLIDCNNFYASCERVFRPDLTDKPIAVLSNNDGCIVARSAEVKKLDIPMAVPLYKAQKLLDKHNVHIFSSNYPLYGSISARVMRIIEKFTPNVEVYSIDEAFISTDGLEVNHHQLGLQIRQCVKQWTTIPVCIGFAQTKTLAKLANHIAKKQTSSGVFTITEANLSEILKTTEVGEVWGIGRRSAEKLRSHGIRTAAELSQTDNELIRRLITVTGLRTAYELRGIQAVIDEPSHPQSVTSSKSFSSPVTTLDDLKAAVSCYVETAYRKLQAKQTFAGGLSVYLKTNRHRRDLPQYSNLASSGLSFSQNNLSSLIKLATQLMERIYRNGFQYIKVGVIFSDLGNQDYQPGLFDNCTNIQENSNLDDALNKIKANFGNNSIFHAVQGVERSWSMKQEKLSPRYTTSWDEIKTVKI